MGRGSGGNPVPSCTPTVFFHVGTNLFVGRTIACNTLLKMLEFQGLWHSMKRVDYNCER